MCDRSEFVGSLWAERGEFVGIRREKERERRGREGRKRKGRGRRRGREQRRRRGRVLWALGSNFCSAFEVGEVIIILL